LLSADLQTTLGGYDSADILREHYERATTTDPLSRIQYVDIKKQKEPGISWKEPSAWTKVPQRSPMRLATYRVPRAGKDTEDAELAIFHFGSNSGGGIDANMTRWAGQFSDVKPDEIRRSERTANNLTQHVMEIEEGTFATGMPMGPKQPKANSGMLAAIVETPSGLYFIKLTGPSETVKAARDDYFKFLDGVRATDP
jgi:hypothetical protein